MKREIWIPMAVLGLCLVFALICLGLSLWRRNGWLLKKKLRVGAMLLTLTGFVATGGPVACCYATAGDDTMVSLEGESWGGEVTLDLQSGTSLEGQIENCHSLDWSYLLSTPEGTRELQRGDLIPLDGEFEELSEAFRLTLDPGTEPGDYRLCIHQQAAQELDEPLGFRACFGLTVIDSSLDGE